MKRLLTIILILISIDSIGQITYASYTNKGATVPFINSSSYMLNGVTLDSANTVKRGFLMPFQYNYLHSRQEQLVSGTNLRTVGGVSLLGSGNLAITSSQWTSSGANDIYFDGTQIPAGFVGIGITTPLYMLDVNGTSRFGTTSNHTSTEADGTLVFTGDATVYKDVIVQFIYKGGSGEATLDTYIGGIKQLKFLTNDFVALSNAEAPHDWNEASPIELHLHWMVKNALIAGDKIRWQLEYAVANLTNGTNINTLFCDPANPTVFGSRTVTYEYTAPVGGIPAGTQLYASFETVTPTNFKIGAGFIGTLTRIAKTAGGTDPTTGSIFATNIGIHYNVNTIGSRTPAAK